MTENKRFTYKHFDWLQWHIYKDGEFFIEVTDCEEDAKKLCDLLNELYDKNKQLKNKLQTYKTGNILLKTTLNQYQNENQQIRNTITEMYNNERTQIGKNTLKQLMEVLP